MSNKKKIYKPQAISGFPEWTPEVRRAEQLWMDHIRSTFERYGFCSIETPSVETLDAIKAKGGDGESDVDKEVYVLERMHKEDGDKEARLALHFDQTVPLARYTAQHFNDLIFPFKRYQMQRVWRGERPQAGRFREFYQCDIDVINVDDLPLHFDAEMPAIIYETLSSLPGMENENFQIRISNRKILIGFLNSIGVAKELIPKVLRIIDKNGTLIDEKSKQELKLVFCNENEFLKFDADILRYEFINLLGNYNSYEELHTQVKDFLLSELLYRDEYDDQFEEGLNELEFVMKQLSHLPEGSVVADLSIVRGLDYYTGTVYETNFIKEDGSLDLDYGSICSGGRYDDLASSYINKKLPGVGISIGFSRLFDRIRSQGKLPELGTSPAHIMVACAHEDEYADMMEVAKTLRENGMNVETYHKPTRKTDRVVKHANKKKIPYVWFTQYNEVQNLKTGEQIKADPKTWKAE